MKLAVSAMDRNVALPPDGDLNSYLGKAREEIR